MQERQLDLVLVPLGLLALALYHSWLLFAILRRPKSTVIGLNALARRRWVQAIGLPEKRCACSTNGAQQHNGIDCVSNHCNNSGLHHQRVCERNELLGLLCASLWYYAHVSFLVTTPPPSSIESRGGDFVSVKYVARSLNRGSFFWSLGLRAFYMSFTLFLWIFGPIPMFASCIMMCSLLYFLDTTTEHTRDLHESFRKMEIGEVEEDNV
ncbi:hypothetical protein AXF42_Ash006730 [Apostasia shenzhenica]|uniref:Uncharacterized protein n=1 Tax=Apostasia shenzhenica TaxID=1088818 RepID=A0A2I0AJ09_9ASPA|nr:hypothetical protein AXF42_Ash006730 [Apostasia shenzhenica]